MSHDNLSNASLRAQGVGAGVVQSLELAREDVASRLRAIVANEVAAYAESGNPEIVPELHEHLDALLEHVIRWAGGSRDADAGFVRQHAERRAEQRFPLEALLHTYRSVHRPLFEWLRDAAVENADETAHIRRVVAAAADFAIECTDLVSTTATSSYVAFTRRLAEAEGDRRAELLKLLLLGYDESDPRAAQLLRRSGYLAQRQSYCVVAARSVNPEEMRNAARAQRMADAIGKILARTAMKTLIGIRDDVVIAVVSGTRRQSGWTAPQTVIADRLYAPLRLVGPAALIGMSNDVPATSYIPRAATEALCALEFASVAERVKPYSTVSLRQRLVAIAREDTRATLPAWLHEFHSADTRGRLAATLQAYADADMNVQKTAKALNVHPNTIYARAQRIEDITGKSLLSYNDLTELLLAIECGPIILAR